MTKPSNLFTWATTPGSTAEPSPGEKASGFGYGDKVPAPWINWLWNGAHQWFQFLNNLHTEEEFLNKDYSWGGEHSFAGTLTTAQEILYAAPRECSLMLPLDLSFPCDVAGSQSLDDGSLGWSTNNGTLQQGAGGVYNARRWPFRLPHDATLLGARIGYLSPTPQHAQFWLRRIRADRTPPFTPSVTDLAYSDVTIPTQEHPISPLALPATVIGSSDTFAVDVLMSAAGQGIRYIEVVYSEIVATGYR
jgi:hypothetical protein